MKKTLVILVVGLSPALVGPHTPHLQRLAQRGGMRSLKTVTPAVTCTVQSTLVTGELPSGHGAVANGWFFRDLSEVWFWRQSNHLVGGEKIWEAGRKRNADFTTAKMFWWYNMYASAEWSATPRPMYPADGRKIPDHYAFPGELHDELDQRFGQFPLFKFWGPATDITSSEWIARATQHVIETRNPTLALTYLPHLDYNLQRLGPDLAHPRLIKDLEEIDSVCGELIEAADKEGREVVIVSEYGITPVRDAIHINRALREAGLIRVRVEEHGREQFDAGASDAFAVADHQLAHIYVRPGPSPSQTSRRLSKSSTVSKPCSMMPANGPMAWITRDRGSWLRSPRLTAGSAITTGSMMPRRRTMRAPSIFTASLDTIRSSCSLTLRYAGRCWPLDGGLANARWACARCSMSFRSRIRRWLRDRTGG